MKKWWYGAVFSDIFWSFVGVLESILTQRQIFLLQFIIIPFTFLVDWWYGISMKLAYGEGVSYSHVTAVNIFLGLIASAVFGRIILHQTITVRTVAGFLVILAGVALLGQGKG